MPMSCFALACRQHFSTLLVRGFSLCLLNSHYYLNSQRNICQIGQTDDPSVLSLNHFRNTLALQSYVEMEVTTHGFEGTPIHTDGLILTNGAKILERHIQN